MICSRSVAAAALAGLLLLLSDGENPMVGVLGQPTTGCDDRCGDVRVQYPFGIDGSGCRFLPGFNLTCDRTQQPNRLFLDKGSLLQVSDISLANSTVRVLNIGGTVNFIYRGKRDDNGTWAGVGVDNGPYIVSEELNQLVVTGCNVMATLVGGNQNVIIGCSSFCSISDWWGKPIVESSPNGNGTEPSPNRGGRCSGGLGCCDVNIPIGRPTYSLQLKWLDWDNNYDGTLPIAVRIAERGWFDGMSADLLRTDTDTGSVSTAAVPVVLEWAVASVHKPPDNDMATDMNWTCPKDPASSECRSSNSFCRNVTNMYRSGYVCNCRVGYQGNPYLTGGCLDIDECSLPGKCFGECTNTPGSYNCRCPRGARGDPHTKDGCIKFPLGLSVGIGVGSGAGLLFLVFGASFATREAKHRRAKKLKQKFFKQNRGHLLQQLISQRADIAERMILSLVELEKATNNFDKARELGGGGHGTVYKGILSDLHVVAIKKSKEAIQREIDEFINEVAILSQINHRNVVKLFGCCLETKVPLLVYEFISNGTLYEHLHVEGPISLSWEDRLRIATETARALAYLHSAVAFPIIHRDIKSHNILLDSTLTAKISDFGASRCIPMDQTGVTTVVQGTRGYLDPMYYYTGRLTEKSDVYSFGVILIELLTRKKPFSYRSPEGDSLVAHFTCLLAEGNLVDILDPQIIEDGGRGMIEVAALAAVCVKLGAEERPTMRQVEMTLERHGASLQEHAGLVATQSSEIGHVAEDNYPTTEESSRQYSLEVEYLLSARYPR
ncbi:hypothetical protein E2562_019816 [Oryza meyeriana var. granulata]|uniref:Protein kinase domain-containing protein n=1 Tax=Oryza meyeriana var. granulata TaxID=110450 RepID=A0A6G1DMV5_9ORYZ|nr:hypothetical protein E2562_019816 [Oryza meyeriana var. granulata]